jgi:hypothetical protein
VAAGAAKLGDDGADFLKRRNVDADLEQALLAAVAGALLVAGATLVGDVLRYQPTVLGVGQDAGQRQQDGQQIPFPRPHHMPVLLLCSSD